jgi:hypothetical protein
MLSKKRYGAGLLTPVFCLTLVLMLQSQMTNPRINSFLNSLSTLASADAARAAFNTAKFSEDEERLLKTGLRDPKYSIQMERLAKTVKLPPGPQQPPIRELSALKLDQARNTERLNKRLTSEAESLLAVSARLSPGAMQAIAGTVPKITSLSQMTIEPGQELIIRGTDFLPQGSVTFTFGSSSFPGTVVYWNTEFILVTFPADVKGIGETDGTVTVRKPNPRLNASAAIHFVPLWNYIGYWSNRLEYGNNPYDAVAAYYGLVFWGRMSWCSTFTISYPPEVPTRLSNGYKVDSVDFRSEGHYINRQYENGASYLGLSVLPSATAGVLCHSSMGAPTINCYVRVKGPLGLFPQ